MHLLENEYLRIKVREYGAELTSIYDKKNGLERLWNADPAFWDWHAPVLFPVVGRCLNDEIIVNGKSYAMEKHGFAGKSNFKLLELGGNKMVLSLTCNEDTLRVYPFKFEFLIGYTLKGNCLHCSYEVINKDDKPIYFQLGGHPAFAVPPVGGSEPSEYSDYYLEFEQIEHIERYYINADGFFDGRTELVLDGSKTLALQKDLFKDDALIFKDLKSRKISIKSPGSERFLSVAFGNFNYLGLWAKVNAPYVCIEPWLGCAGSVNKKVELSEKEGVISLPVNQTFTAAFDVEIG